MIITRADSGDDWTCLIRRGMLHSDTESVEHWNLAAGRTLDLAGLGVDETLIVLTGACTLDGRSMGPGSAAFAAERTGGLLTAEEPSTVLSVRTYAARASKALPPRVPELPENERAL
ncbi:hypothetical protein [Salininema proteolyticum]|uniref:Uncharacterized protein n=1 Tax=Salininema proteolyticum TaxID=1607685 RepID=A0ABV8TY98_9ACTN